MKTATRASHTNPSNWIKAIFSTCLLSALLAVVPLAYSVISDQPHSHTRQLKHHSVTPTRADVLFYDFKNGVDVAYYSNYLSEKYQIAQSLELENCRLTTLGSSARDKMQSITGSTFRIEVNGAK